MNKEIENAVNKNKIENEEIEKIKKIIKTEESEKI